LRRSQNYYFHFNPEDGSSMLLWNLAIYLQYYIMKSTIWTLTKGNAWKLHIPKMYSSMCLKEPNHEGVGWMEVQIPRVSTSSLDTGKSQNSPVCIETRLRALRPRNSGLIPGRDKNFSPERSDGPWCLPNLLPSHTGGSLSRGKTAGA
jgi:hypothetical protein